MLQLIAEGKELGRRGLEEKGLEKQFLDRFRWLLRLRMIRLSHEFINYGWFFTECDRTEAF